MTKLIIQNFFQLLIIAAVCGGLAWLLPVKVSIALLFILQVLTLTILGYILRSKDDGKKP